MSKITPAEAAEIATEHIGESVSRSTVYTWIRTGKLKAEKFFGRVRIDEVYFRQWLKDNTQSIN
ncbi:MAG: helix-turn-helix domain-containing protein [Bacteroidota bacterium]